MAQTHPLLPRPRLQAVLQATGLEPAPALDAEVARAGAVLGGDTACISALHCWKVFADRLGVATDNAEQVGGAGRACVCGVCVCVKRERVCVCLWRGVVERERECVYVHGRAGVGSDARGGALVQGH